LRLSFFIVARAPLVLGLLGRSGRRHSLYGTRELLELLKGAPICLRRGGLASRKPMFEVGLVHSDGTGLLLMRLGLRVILIFRGLSFAGRHCGTPSVRPSKASDMFDRYDP
jgi:hypothetical protein